MPKIVDHDQYRAELALKAADVFLENGYSRLGMRQLATELGVSKSKLYHYFPSKEALFSASTEAIVQHDIEQLDLEQRQLSNEQQVDSILSLVNALLPRFANELQLTLDYIQVIGITAIASDSIMQLAQNKYRQLFAQIVGSDKAEQAYTVALGIMNNRLLSGDSQCLEEDKHLIEKLLF